MDLAQDELSWSATLRLVATSSGASVRTTQVVREDGSSSGGTDKLAVVVCGSGSRVETDDEGTLECAECQAGTYSDAVELSSCTSCPLNS